jgi:hypothetical protein
MVFIFLSLIALLVLLFLYPIRFLVIKVYDNDGKVLESFVYSPNFVSSSVFNASPPILLFFPNICSMLLMN